VEEFKYLGTTLTNQSSNQKEIKSRLPSWNVCSHLVQNILSFSFLSKNKKIHRTRNLHAVLYGYETSSLILREECRLRVLRGIFGSRREEVMAE